MMLWLIGGLGAAETAPTDPVVRLTEHWREGRQREAVAGFERLVRQEGDQNRRARLAYGGLLLTAKDEDLKTRGRELLAGLVEGDAHDEIWAEAACEQAVDLLGRDQTEATAGLADRVLSAGIECPALYRATLLMAKARRRQGLVVDPADGQKALIALAAAKRAVEHGLDLKRRFDYLAIPLDLAEGRRLKQDIEQDIENLRLGQPLADFRAAERLRKSGKVDEALPLYRRVVERHAAHALAQESGFRIGQCLATAGARDEAVQHWQDFAAAEPQGPWRGQALLALGDDAFERRLDVDAAERHFAAILATPGRDATWAMVLADVQERVGICRFLRRDFDGCEAALARSLELRPRRIQSTTGEEVANPLDDLLAMCRRKQHPVYYADQVMHGDVRVQTLLFLASAYLEIGRVDESLVLFARLDGKEFDRVLPVQRDYARMERAEALRLQLKFDQALTVLEPFERELQTSPLAPMALFEKARLHVTQGQKPEAMALLNRVARDWPKSDRAPQALFTAGFLAYFAEDWSGALTCFRPLAARYPQTWYAERVKAYEIPDCREKLERVGRRDRKESP